MLFSEIHTTFAKNTPNRERHLQDTLSIHCKIDSAKHLLSQFFSQNALQRDSFPLLHDIGFSVAEMASVDSQTAASVTYTWDTESHRDYFHLSGTISILPSRNAHEVIVSIDGYCARSIDTVNATLANPISSFFDKALFRRLLMQIRDFIEHQEQLADLRPRHPLPRIDQSHRLSSLCAFHAASRSMRPAYA